MANLAAAETLELLRDAGPLDVGNVALDRVERDIGQLNGVLRRANRREPPAWDQE